jgi:hypothetical protein
MCGEIFGGDLGAGLAVDYKAITTKHDRCFDSFALANGADEIANGGHQYSGKVAAKERAASERSQAMPIA